MEKNFERDAEPPSREQQIFLTTNGHLCPLITGAVMSHVL